MVSEVMPFLATAITASLGSIVASVVLFVSLRSHLGQRTQRRILNQARHDREALVGLRERVNGCPHQRCPLRRPGC